MKRLVAAFALWLCVAIRALAQKADNLPLIGILRINTPDTSSLPRLRSRTRWRRSGWSMAARSASEVRLAEGLAERLPELAQSLVRAKASVIVAYGVPAIRAAQQATSTIPIVGFGDLLSKGLIGSLARPGGNTTGVSILNTDLDARTVGTAGHRRESLDAPSDPPHDP